MTPTSLHFLLIDDNANDRGLAARAVLAEFPEGKVHELENRPEALEEALRQAAFDAVITDYQLRWTTGLEILKQVKARFPFCPVVMFTNTGNEDVAAEGLRNGLDDYVTKSAYHYPRLAVAVRGAMERCRFRSAREQMLQELQLAKQRLEEANRLKDEFLATMSHELRTPLNAIAGWTALLTGAQATSADVSEGLGVIERNTRALTRMVEDLLDVSRIVAGTLRLEMKPVALDPIVQAVVQAAGAAAAARNVTIRMEQGKPSERVLGDPQRLRQVVWNLLLNALKFSEAGGTITVALKRVAAELELTVTDTGAGIEPSFLPHLFEVFRQADASTTRRYGGLGVGLSIVKNLVELHNGRVSASSAGLGQGATFTITLPVAAQTDANLPSADPTSTPSSPVTANPPAELQGVRVLVVDDDADAVGLVRTILSRKGAMVSTAGSAADAFELISRERPDVLVSDIGMPQEDGLSLMRRIRSTEVTARRRLPGVALTAFGRPEDRKAAILAGYQSHLAKPFEPAELLATVANLARVTAP